MASCEGARVSTRITSRHTWVALPATLDRVRPVDVGFQINVHRVSVRAVMKTIGKIFAVLLTAGIFYLGTYVWGEVPLGSPLFYALASLLVGSVVGLIVLAKKLK